jgi:hypothetical protein
MGAQHVPEPGGPRQLLRILATLISAWLSPDLGETRATSRSRWAEDPCAVEQASDRLGLWLRAAPRRSGIRAGAPSW